MLKQFTDKFTTEEFLRIFVPRKDEEGKVSSILMIIGILLTPITLIGVVWFYIRSYFRHMQPEKKLPELKDLLPITKFSMAIGGVVIWAILFILIKTVVTVTGGHFAAGDFMLFLAITTIPTFLIMFAFNRWRYTKIMNLQADAQSGSAVMGTFEDMRKFCLNDGILIANEMRYEKAGHILTVGGTGSGKFANLIAPNLLQDKYKGSWFVIDVKGEIFSVTAKWQKQYGQTVIILNPWNLLQESDATYNPLDLIDVYNEESLIDDASIISQMIVPETAGDKDPYWRNRARSWVTGMIIHLMLGQEEKTITQIWTWLRLSEKDFATLIVDMMHSDNKVVKGTGNEIMSIRDSEKAFSSILSTAQDATDFLKSPALQKSLKTSNFNINDLSNGKTTIYVVIPADKLDTQSQWLRLVVTTALLAVVRNKNEKVTFVLDEFAALGKMDIINTYMALARGYNITLWPILQSLQQLASIYGQGWETFIANAAVRHYFGIADNFTSDYVSNAFGQTTFSPDYYIKDKGRQRNPRALKTPDEIRRETGIFIQVEQQSPYCFQKSPYFETLPYMHRAEKNPYAPKRPKIELQSFKSWASPEA